MSISQSNITNQNYDLVMGVSQRAINGILKDYYHNAGLYGKLKEQVVYFQNDFQMPKEQALGFTGGVDPLQVPSWDGTGTMPAAVAACKNRAVFAVAFTPGDPDITVFPEYDYSYVTFIPQDLALDATLINYTLICSTFQIAFWNDDNGTWVNFTQSNAKNTPKADLVQFVWNAALKPVNVAYNPSDASLPLDVKKKAAALSAQNISFSFQNLMMSLDDGGPTSEQSILPFMNNYGNTYEGFAEAFGTAYIAAVTGIVNPLTYSIHQNGSWNQFTINPTSLDYSINGFVDKNGNVISSPSKDQFNLTTLNYFCSVNGDTPAKATQLPWNWLDNDNDAANYNGAMALSKYALAKLLDVQLRRFINGNCWVPVISCSNSNGVDQWNFDMSRTGTVNSYTLATDNSNGNLADYKYKVSNKVYGVVNPGDSVEITIDYETTVVISSTTSITISQAVTINYYATINGIPSSGVPVLNVYKDVYAIVVQANGTLDFELQGNNPPSYFTQTIPGLSNDANEAFNNAIGKAVCEFEPGELSPQPLGESQQIFFPGGTVFTFNKAAFTASNDLTFSFTYNNQV